MPIVRVNSFAERYGLYAREIQKGAAPLSALSGRSRDATEFTSGEILRHLSPGSSDLIADIGCGDGTLLKLAAAQIREGMGIVPTVDELLVLNQASFPENIRFDCGLVQSIPLPSAAADNVVCNGVLLLLEDDAAVGTAISELARITRSGGTVWVGEVAEVDEYTDQTMRQASLVRWLEWRWKQRGTREFLHSLGQLVRSGLTNQAFVIIQQSHFYSGPEHFLELASWSGLVCKEYFRSRYLGEQGKVLESKTRYDYVLMRQEAETL